MKFFGILLVFGYVMHTESSWVEKWPTIVSSFKRIAETVSNTITGKEDWLFRKEFEEYKARHNRHYSSPKEEKQRYGMWLINYSQQLLGDPTLSEQINDEEYDRFINEVNEKVYGRFFPQWKSNQRQH